MRNSIEAIIFGFKEILKWNTMKYALISGFIVTSIWVIIGYILWDGMVSLGDDVLGLLPFDMVRSDGAWMLSTFVWLQAVLITFAIVYAFFGNVILNKISKERYASLSLVVGIGSAIFWTVVWFVEGSYIHTQFIHLLTWLPFETVEKGIGFLFAIYIIYNAIVISMLFIINIFSEPLIKHIQVETFKDNEVKKDNLFKSIGFTIKDISKFIILSLISFPLLFIPFVNFLVQIALWMWVTKDILQYNSASLAFGKVEPKELKKHHISIWFITFVSVLFNFIPIFNIFAPFFGEISMFHYWKKIEKDTIIIQTKQKEKK
jgi:hypothetical protein